MAIEMRSVYPMLSKLIVAAFVVLSLSGCIPLSWYIGTQMAETHAHDEWCAQHVGDVACHP
jgi:hypothetical protein